MRRWIAVLVVVLGVAPAPVGADQGLSERLATADRQVELAPDDVDARLRRAELRSASGRPVEALADLAEAERLAPRDPRTFLLRADVHEQLGSLDLAEADLDRHLDLAGPSARGHEARGRLRELRGDLPGARADYEAALLQVATPELVLARGRVAEAMGDFADAAAVYGAGAERLGGAVALRLARVRAARARGRPDLALEEVDRLLAASAEHPDWMELRAEVLDELGRPAEARTWRERTLARLDALLQARATPMRREARERVARALEVSK